MAKMPQDCMDLINNVYAAAVATCDANGVPGFAAWRGFGWALWTCGVPELWERVLVRGF